MEICFRSIFQLVSKPENEETSQNELVKFNWLNQEIRRENFMDEESFTKTLITLISPSFRLLMRIDKSKLCDFVSCL